MNITTFIENFIEHFFKKNSRTSGDICLGFKATVDSFACVLCHVRAKSP